MLGQKTQFLAIILIYSIFLFKTPLAFAQEEGVEETDAENGDVLELQSTIVTGSNLELTESQTFAPISTISFEDILESGANTPIERLRQLPSYFGSGPTENQSNGGMGQAYVNLRGAGILSTVTLINGRRAGGSGGIQTPARPGGFSDLNLLPFNAISEIQVLKDGGATVYGSDAIAGAVNVLLNNDYEGTRIDAKYGNTTEEDAHVSQLALLTGHQIGEKTHITLGASYYERAALFRRDRELTADVNFNRYDAINFSSSTTQGSIVAGGTRQVPVTSETIPTSEADLTPFVQSVHGFNFNAHSPSISGQEIKTAFGAFEHEFGDWITAYADFIFTESQFDTALPPTQLTSTATLVAAAQASPDNPLTDPTTLSEFRYRTTELGNLTQDWKHDVYRATAGLKGNILDSWNWDTAFVYSETDTRVDFDNLIDETIIANSITAGLFNPFTGADPNNASELQNAAISRTNQYEEEFFLYDVKFDGDLAEIYSGFIRGAVGFEYRYESVDFASDPLWNAQTIGLGPPIRAYQAERDVIASYAELIVPLVAPENEIKFLNSLELNLAARFEAFDDDGTDPSGVTTNILNNNYDSSDFKVGIRLSPIEDITLRSSFSTGFRAPALTESYGVGTIDRVPLSDPLGQTNTAFTGEARITTAFVGNADLEPEEAENFSAGIVIHPEKFKNLKLSIDFYHLKRENIITNGAQSIIDQAAAGDPNFTPLVFRDGTGAIVFVNSRYFNVAKVVSQGLEYELSYLHELGENNSLKTILGVSQVLSYKAKSSDNDGYTSFKGRASDPGVSGISPGSVPNWKGFLSLFWYYGDFTLGGTANYVDSLEDDTDPFLRANPFTSAENRRVESYMTFDIYTSYAFQSENSWIDGITIYAGIENLTDEAPPFSRASLAAPPFDGYDVSLYNNRNRFYYFGFSKEF